MVKSNWRRSECLFLLFYSLFLLKRDGVRAHEDTLLDSMQPVKEEDAQDYLNQFGYNKPSQLNVKTEGMAGDLSNMFEVAVKTFQEFAHLPITGKLDIKTRKKMAEPRCGMQDTVEMLSADGGPAFKWKKNALTYSFVNFTPDLPKETVREAIKKAFGLWASVSPLTFREVPSADNADIKIRFASGMHDDPWPFDKKGGVLAHATMPPSGMLHFDEAEDWTFMDANKIKTHKFTDILPVAIHEGGHALGLSHSKAEESIMAPFYQETVDAQGHYIQPELKADDIRAIQAIYGPKKGGGAATQSQHHEEGNERKVSHSQQHAVQHGGGVASSSSSAGEEPTLGQLLWKKGKTAVKNMFTNWLRGNNRKRR